MAIEKNWHFYSRCMIQPAVVWYISEGRPHNNWEDTWTLIYQLESHERLYYVIS